MKNLPKRSSDYKWKGKSVKPVSTTKWANICMVGIVQEKDKGIKNLFDKIFNCVPDLPREGTFQYQKFKGPQLDSTTETFTGPYYSRVLKVQNRKY